MLFRLKKLFLCYCYIVFSCISYSYGSISVRNLSDDEDKALAARFSQSSHLERRIKDTFTGFENKIKDETNQKNSILKETEQGIETKSRRLQELVNNIEQQKNYINTLIDQIQTQVNERNRQNIPNELIENLRREISSIGVPYNNLGDASSYHDYQRYQHPNPGGYSRTKSSSYLQNICDQIDTCATLVHNLVYQNSDSIWDRSGTIKSKSEDIKNYTYNWSDSCHKVSESVFCNHDTIRRRANSADNRARNICTEVDAIRSAIDAIKSHIISIKDHASNLKNEIRSYETDSDSKIDNNKTLMQTESWNKAKDYGDIVLQKSLEKGRIRIVEVHQLAINLAQSRIDRIIPVYFDRRDLSNSQSYQFKIEPIQQNVSAIRQASITINSASREINDISRQVLYLAKNQHAKIDVNYGALVKKGTQLEETAKQLSKEFLTVSQSLVVVVKDKQQQVQTLIKAEKNLKESFKVHEKHLIESHDHHISDLKEQKNELIKIKNEMIDNKSKAVKELEEENKNLRSRMNEYEKKIQEIPLRDQNELKIKMVDSMLEAMMSLLQMDISDLKSKNISGPELAQQCLMKIIQNKK